jgi:hypothetical protein
MGLAATGFTVATGVGCATAAFAAGFLRITTTGVLFASRVRSGIGVFFLERAGKSILIALSSCVMVTAKLGVLCSLFSLNTSLSVPGLRFVACSPHPSSMMAMSVSQWVNFFSLMGGKRRAISGPVSGCACRYALMIR